MRELGDKVACEYCDEVFPTAEDWQRHNLRAHMVHSTGVGPLPEEQTEEPKPSELGPERSEQPQL